MRQYSNIEIITYPPSLVPYEVATAHITNATSMRMVEDFREQLEDRFDAAGMSLTKTQSGAGRCHILPCIEQTRIIQDVEDAYKSCGRKDGDIFLVIFGVKKRWLPIDVENKKRFRRIVEITTDPYAETLSESDTEKAIETIIQHYSDTNMQGQSEPAEPWRDGCSLDDNDQQTHLLYIRSYKPELPLRAKIVVTGPKGAGKSSFVNTVLSALAGRKVPKATSATTDGARSTTRQLKCFKPDAACSISYLFNMYDTMGLEKENIQFTGTEFGHLLKGLLKPDYEFGALDLSVNADKYRDNPTLEHRMHLVVIVLNALTLVTLDGAIIDRVKSDRSMADGFGIPVALVLTHCDLAFPDILGDVSRIYFNLGVKKAVEIAVERTGVPLDKIFPFVNDVLGKQTKQICTITSYTFDKLLGYVNDYLSTQVIEDDD